MKEIELQNHGLPGIGVSGKVGIDGKAGNSVHFGPLESFFESVEVDVSAGVFSGKLENEFYTGIISEDGTTTIGSALAGMDFESVDDMINFALTDPQISKSFTKSKIEDWLERDDCDITYNEDLERYVLTQRVCVNKTAIFAEGYEEDFKVKVPKSFMSNIHLGDIIVASANSNDGIFNRMIYVNEDIIEKTYKEILYSEFFNPYKLSTFSEYVSESISSVDYSRMRTTYPMSICVYESYSLLAYDYMKRFNVNFANLIIKDEKTPLLLSQFDVDGNVDMLALIPMNRDASEKLNNSGKLLIKSERTGFTGQCSLNTITSDKNIMMNDIIVANDAVTNCEMMSTYIPSGFETDGSGYVKSLTNDDFDTTSMSFKIDRVSMISDVESIDDYNIGYVIFDNSTNESYEEFSPENDEIKLPVKYNDSVTREDLKRPVKGTGTFIYDFTLLFYIANKDGMKHFALPERVYIEVPEKGNVNVKISTEDYVSGYSFSEFEENIYIEDDGDLEISTTSNLTAEEDENALVEMLIEKTSNVKEIKSVVVNGCDLKTNKNFKGSWFDVSLLEDTSDSSILKLKPTSSNLPGGVATIKELLTSGDSTDTSSYSSKVFYDIANGTLSSTLARSMSVAINYVTIDGIEKRVIKEITQSGFNDMRCMPEVNLVPHVDPATLEKCNDKDVGCLSNQMQFFVDLDIKGFGKDGWSANTDDILADIELIALHEDYDNEIAVNAKLSDYANFCFLKNDSSLNSSTGLGFSVDLIDCSSNVFDEAMSNVDKLSLPDVSSDDNATFGLNSSASYVRIESSDSSSLNYDKDTLCGDLIEVPSNEIKDLTYKDGIRCNATYTLKNVPVEKLSSDNPLRLRFIIENMTPSMMKFMFALAVSKIEIRYRLDESDEYTKFTLVDKSFNDIDHAEGLLFNTVNAGTTTINVPMYRTPKIDIYALPVSFTAVYDNDQPKQLDNSTVKIAGSTTLIKNAVYIDNDMLKDQSISKLTGKKDIDIISGTNAWHEISELKNRHFNDNVEDMIVEFVDPLTYASKTHESYWISQMKKFSTNSDIDHSSTSSYDSARLNLDMTERKLFVDLPASQPSKFDSCAYLGLTYSKSILRNRMRDDVDTFYYNDELLEADRYSQIQKESPHFVNADIAIKIRDEDFFKSLRTWNFEFSNSMPEISTSFTGIVSEYADGYSKLSTDIDAGQYASEAHSLEKLIELQNSRYLEEPNVVDLDYSTYKYFPKPNKLFRTLLMNACWEMPVTSGKEIIPFKIVSAEEGFIDGLFLDKVFEHNSAKDSNDYYAVNGPVDSSIANAYKDELLATGNAMKSLKESYISNKMKIDSENVEFAQMIPYNRIATLTPRVLFNDTVNAPVVLMLRRPSIIKEDQYEMSNDDLCFSIDEIEKCSSPYKV